MERAALKVVEETEKYLWQKETEEILVSAEVGKTEEMGCCCQIIPSERLSGRILYGRKQRKMTRETLLQYKIASGYQVPEVNNPASEEYTTIVDAVFGVGLTRPIEGSYAEIIHEMNSCEG